MIDAGHGRRISDVVPAPWRRVPDTHRAWMPDLLTSRYLVGTGGTHSMVRIAARIDLHGGVPDQVGWVGEVQLVDPAEHARHHGHQERGHANVVPPGGFAARVYGTHAGDSQLAAGQARRQRAPFSLAGLSATLTGISRSGFGAHSPSWMARTTNAGAAGRRPPGPELAATRTGRPDSHATYSVTAIPAVY